jgi:hypothetical protein
MEDAGDPISYLALDAEESRLQEKLRRAWDLITGNY